MEDNQSLFSLTIDPVTKAHLNDTAKWARFLAIAGMIVMGLAFLFFLLAITVLADFQNTIFHRQEVEAFSSVMKIVYAIGMIIFFAITFLPLLFLLQFANRLKIALAANQQDDLRKAFQNLKKCFRYVGIIFIIVLSVYVLIFLLAIIASGGQLVSR